jgi:hypothetical protein
MKNIHQLCERHKNQYVSSSRELLCEDEVYIEDGLLYSKYSDDLIILISE